MSLVNFNQKVQRIIQDEAAILNKADIDNFILESLSYYSKDRPQVKVADITGDGGYEYDLPISWNLGFSSIKNIEYPAGERIPTFLEPGDWMIYRNSTGIRLRFLHHTPESGETVRLTYSTLYEETEIDLISTGDQDAFCSMAASLCCGALARYYSQTVPSPQEVSVVDFPAKATEYAERAKELLNAYNKHVKTPLRE